MEISEILAKCDHTLLSPAATWEDIKALSFEKYPEILDLMQEDIIDCTIDSELERQGEIPVQIIMDQLVLKKAPPEQNIYTDIRILIKECLF